MNDAVANSTSPICARNSTSVLFEVVADLSRLCRWRLVSILWFSCNMCAGVLVRFVPMVVVLLA